MKQSPFFERPIGTLLTKSARDPGPENLTCFSKNTQNVKFKEKWEFFLTLKELRLELSIAFLG